MNVSPAVAIRDVFLRLDVKGQVIASDQGLISIASALSLCREVRARGGSMVADDLYARVELPRAFGSHLHLLIFERTYV